MSLFQNFIKIALLILLQCSIINCQPNFQYYITDCSTPDFQEQLQRLKLDKTNLYIFFICTSIGVIATTTIIYLSYKIKKLRQPPGDILFGLAISELILSYHWLSISIHTADQENPIISSGTFCQFESVVGILAGTLELLYNCFFYAFIILQFRNSLKQKSINHIKIHILIWVIAISVSTFAYLLKFTGKNFYGTCSFASTQRFPVLGVFLISVFFIISFFSMQEVRKRFPNRQIRKQLKIQFLTFTKRQIQACVFLWGILFFSNLFVFLNCQNWHSYDFQFTIILLGNLAKSLTPCILPLIRLFDPFIQEAYVKNKNIHKIGIDNLNNQSQEITQQLNRNSIYIIDNKHNAHILEQQNVSFDLSQQHMPQQFIELTDITDKTQTKNDELQNVFSTQNKLNNGQNTINTNNNNHSQIKIDQSKKNSEQQDERLYQVIIQENIQTLKKFKQMLKVSILYKMISSILLVNKEKNPLPLFRKENAFDSYNEIQTFNFDNQIVQSTVSQLPQFIFQEIYNNGILESKKITLFYPSVFKNILQTMKEKIIFEESLSILENTKQFENSSSNDGGKSGEFFFFSYDNKLLLKTITKNELQLIKKIIHNYHKYLISNPDSLIAKILGIYQFENFDDEEITIILMENMLQGCPIKNIQSIFDMKGSSFDREVLIKTENVTKTTTLKDLDFLKTQQSVKISQIQAKNSLSQLKKDSDFLCQNGMIDYSLILFKIENNEKFQFQTENNHRAKMIQSDKIYYCFGIIDYLETYRFQKMIEKYAKRFIKCNRKLDTSSQGPNTYSVRFKQFMDKIFIEQKIY